jgi:hypothetical protein
MAVRELVWLSAAGRLIANTNRYSMLPLVFAQLVKQGHVAESDLHSLDPEKIQVILGVASRL